MKSKLLPFYFTWTTNHKVQDHYAAHRWIAWGVQEEIQDGGTTFCIKKELNIEEVVE